MSPILGMISTADQGHNALLAYISQEYEPIRVWASCQGHRKEFSRGGCLKWDFAKRLFLH